MLQPGILNAISYNPITPLVFRGVASTDIVTWDDVEYLMNTTLDMKGIKLLDANGFVKVPAVSDLWVNTSVNREALFEKINNGTTIIIDQASRINEKINSVCDMVERQYRRTQVDAHIYCGTSASSLSFNAHWDPPDNIIIQQDGECQWVVYKEFGSGDVQHAENSLTEEYKFVTSPGDLIFIPAYKYHKCIPVGKRLSVSIPVPPNEWHTDRKWYKII